MSGNLTVGNPAECHEHALHCSQLGEGAPTLEARQALLHLAESWIRLAAELENAQSFLSVTPPSDTGQPKFEVGVEWRSDHRQGASHTVLRDLLEVAGPTAASP